jgi:hypothetical protein
MTKQQRDAQILEQKAAVKLAEEAARKEREA